MKYIIVLLLLCLCGCSIRPLHITQQSHFQLGSITADNGSRLRNSEIQDLIKKRAHEIFNCNSNCHTVNFAFSYSKNPGLIQDNSITTRENIYFDLKYVVLDQNLQEISSGTIHESESYSFSGSHYSNYIAQDELIKRLAMNALENSKILLH